MRCQYHISSGSYRACPMTQGLRGVQCFSPCPKGLDMAAGYIVFSKDGGEGPEVFGLTNGEKFQIFRKKGAACSASGMMVKERELETIFRAVAMLSVDQELLGTRLWAAKEALHLQSKVLSRLQKNKMLVLQKAQIQVPVSARRGRRCLQRPTYRRVAAVAPPAAGAHS